MKWGRRPDRGVGPQRKDGQDARPSDTEANANAEEHLLPAGSAARRLAFSTPPWAPPQRPYTASGRPRAAPGPQGRLPLMQDPRSGGGRPAHLRSRVSPCLNLVGQGSTADEYGPRRCHRTSHQVTVRTWQALSCGALSIVVGGGAAKGWLQGPGEEVGGAQRRLGPRVWGKGMWRTTGWGGMPVGASPCLPGPSAAPSRPRMGELLLADGRPPGCAAAGPTRTC